MSRVGNGNAIRWIEVRKKKKEGRREKKGRKAKSHEVESETDYE